MGAQIRGHWILVEHISRDAQHGRGSSVYGRSVRKFHRFRRGKRKDSVALPNRCNAVQHTRNLHARWSPVCRRSWKRYSLCFLPSVNFHEGSSAGFERLAMLRSIGFSFAVLTLLCVCSIGKAQAPAGGFGGGRGPAVVSPQVNADHTITLRFRAPDAKDVVVIGELDGKEHPMTKGDDGVWTATIGPLAADIYNYQFRVDGV